MNIESTSTSSVEPSSIESSSAIPRHDTQSSDHPDLQPSPSDDSSQVEIASSSAPPINSTPSLSHDTYSSSDSIPSVSSEFNAVSAPPLDPNASLGELIRNSGRPLEEVLNSQEAIHAAVSVPDLSLIGLDHGFFSAPGYAADALVALHNITGLPWCVCHSMVPALLTILGGAPSPRSRSLSDFASHDSSSTTQNTTSDTRPSYRR